MEFINIDEEQSRLIEGISNQVVGVFTLLGLIIVPCFYVLWKNRHRAMEAIHPANLEFVQELRARLRLGANVGTENDQQTEPNVDVPTPERLYNDDRLCPICYGVARFAVQTNCGHLFCGGCICGYWSHVSSVIRPVNCPVCRTEISILLPSFSEADPNEPGRLEATRNINDYNRRFSGGSRPLWDHIRDLPVLLPYLISQLFSMDGLMWVFRIRVLLCLAAICIYVLSPLDIIPEAVFGLFGLLDDLFVAFVLLLYATVAFRQVLANRND